MSTYKKLSKRIKTVLLKTDMNLFCVDSIEKTKIIDNILNDFPERLLIPEYTNIPKEIHNNIFSVGVLNKIIDIDSATDIVINGCSSIYVDYGNGPEKLNDSEIISEFNSSKKVMDFARKISMLAGVSISPVTPIVDGSIEIQTGAHKKTTLRFNIICEPLCPKGYGAIISIRILRLSKLSFSDLVDADMINPKIVPLLLELVNSRKNILISGGTGTGKTTFLSSILEICSNSDRIISIEDTPEIDGSVHPHIVPLYTRNPNNDGVGEVTAYDLLNGVLRMRPDRIVLGECRGREIEVLLNAFNTGHTGGISSIHSNGISDIPARLFALGSYAGLTETMITSLSISAFDILIHLSREPNRRYISDIAMLTLNNGHLATKSLIKINADGTAFKTKDYFEYIN
ncbi:MAG: Flp pilus assembly complex ATPase component TadA [Bifidobacteriaceae bacterium]|jgi:pilus assembly protein CpaF|nr:Flp pilus assembly complex ATPase component TadA [Bifidobacteriaceae bacterium]